MKDAAVARGAGLHARVALPAVERVAAQAQRHIQVVHGQRALQLGGVFNGHARALGQIRAHGVGGVAQQGHHALGHLVRPAHGRAVAQRPQAPATACLDHTAHHLLQRCAGAL